MRKLLLPAACALAACTPDFDPASHVQDLRVLAIQAEPPEAMVDFSADSVDPVKVTALVANPASAAPFLTTFRVCFPTDDGVCGTGSAIVPQVDDETPVERTIAVDASFVAAAQQDDRLKGFGGIRVQLSLDVSAGDSGAAVSAHKLLVYTPAGTNPARNHNPAIDSIVLSNDGVAFDTFHPGDAAPCLPVGTQIGLLPQLGSGPQGAETYTTIDLSGNTVTLTESPRYSFFATDPGDLDADTGNEPLPGTIPPRGLVRLTALREGPGTAWIVVRDGRGGEGWISMPFDGRPSCQ